MKDLWRSPDPTLNQEFWHTIYGSKCILKMCVLCIWSICVWLGFEPFILSTHDMKVLFFRHFLLNMSYIIPCLLCRVHTDVYWLVMLLSSLKYLLFLSANSKQYFGWRIECHQFISGSQSVILVSCQIGPLRLSSEV